MEQATQDDFSLNSYRFTAGNLFHQLAPSFLRRGRGFTFKVSSQPLIIGIERLVPGQQADLVFARIARGGIPVRNVVAHVPVRGV